MAERTLGWLTLDRRLVRDYEALSGRSEAMIHIVVIDFMTRRLTGENTPVARALNPGTDGIKRPLICFSDLL
ncbi:hypothetical protein [Nonomuraea sp. KM90]|uniref:hypothetical protein n=1 Tax=Nonomuraea sp. KM90 TaxID=3457428 RepID=UPI003FCD445C